MRWVSLLPLALLVGCATNRTITITTKPPDAMISIDGEEKGRGEVTNQFTFTSADDTHRVIATRPGYRDSPVLLTRDYDKDTLHIDMRPMSKKVTFIVTPVPAVVFVNGQPLSNEPVGQISKELEFTLDARNNWTSYHVTAERPGFEPAEQNVTWTDNQTDYTLQLDPMRKDVSITTTPPGAKVYIDDELIGTSPVEDKGRAFAFNPDTNQWIPRKVKLVKPGYDPEEKTISWDDKKQDYHFDLVPKTKTVRIVTDPTGAVVSIDGKPLPKGDDGVPTAQLSFPPTDDQGDLPTYIATATKKTQDTEWSPTTLPIGWDNGRSDYSVKLPEIKTRDVPLTWLSIRRNDDGVWDLTPATTMTLAMKDTTEGPARETPTRVYAAPQGTTVDSMTVAPDGSQILFTILLGKDKNDFRSQMMVIRTDGTGGTEQVTDGKALDVMPAYTPDGEQIVFSSNRGGRKLNVWQKPANGAPGLTQLTTSSEEQDLWPTVDSDPKPRLFYEALIDGRDDPQLYSARLDSTIRRQLTSLAVAQPKISPKNDSIVFTQVNQKTAKRDIFQISDKGGPAQDLTNLPEADNYDPAWSKDGSRVAFVSDRGVDENGRHNPDIWIMDLAHTDHPVQITTNGSIDDSPIWDPGGNAIYFRSNRGGVWGIWRIAVR